MHQRSTDPADREARWPAVVELSTGETLAFTREIQGEAVTRPITLHGVRETWEPDFWIEDNPHHRTLACAEVTIDVGGQEAILLLRPYQPPVTVNGLRLYVEATRTWGTVKQLDPLPTMRGDVRLSVCGAGEAWSPGARVFPIRDFRWRASTYGNTWSALVPYNLHYYHRGEDFGAIPDRLAVQAICGGLVKQSPLPHGDGGSNTLIIETPGGVDMCYAHMNAESISPDLNAGALVTAGQVLGKTGCTWKGARSQTHDPHLHVGFSANGSAFSPYPSLVEAYFHSFPEAVLPVAGGYHFTIPHEEVVLDASRSLARPGRAIASYTWGLHTGETVSGAVARVRYDAPGLYAEQVVVTADDGSQDRDFAQVRVYDPRRGRQIAYGWAYYTPTRGIMPGTAVTFWNRLLCADEVSADHGDGSAPVAAGSEWQHSYARPGTYTVTLSGWGPDRESVALKLRVIVEAP